MSSAVEPPGARFSKPTIGTTKEQERAVCVNVPLEDLARLCGGKAFDLLMLRPFCDDGYLRNSMFRRLTFAKAAEAIGKPDLTPHGLRHAAASLAIHAGANVRAVQRMLGHADASITLNRYGHLYEDDLDQVAERMQLAWHERLSPLKDSRNG